MPSTCPLCALEPGHTARVASLRAEGSLFERLLDLGFTEQTEVACLYPALFGSPRAYALRGTVVALRNRDAATIYVRPMNAGGLQ